MQNSAAHVSPTRPAGLLRRLLWWAIVIVGAVLIYLLLLGPFWALDARGVIPRPIAQIVWAPARVLAHVHFFRNWYVRYLDSWSRDGMAADVLYPP